MAEMSDPPPLHSGKSNIFWHAAQERPLVVHLPLRLPDRPKHVSAIRRHGGKVCDRFAKSDIVVVDTETASMSDQARELYRAVASLPTRLPCVGPNWITDSVKAELAQNPRNPVYDPISQLNDLEARIKKQRDAQDLSDRRMTQLMRQQAAKNPSLGVMHPLTNSKIRTKNPYTSLDTYHALEEMLSTPHAFGGRKIAEVLSAKHGRHPPGSWISWLRDNMHRGEHLIAKLDEYRETGVNPVKLPPRLKIGENQYVGEAYEIKEANGASTSRQVAPRRRQDDDDDDFEDDDEEEDDPIVSSAPSGGPSRGTHLPLPVNRGVLSYRVHGIANPAAEIVEEQRVALQGQALRRAAEVREESRPIDGWPEEVSATTATKMSGETKSRIVHLLAEDIQTVLDGSYNDAPIIAKHKALPLVRRLSLLGHVPLETQERKELIEVCKYIHEQEEGSVRLAGKVEPDADDERKALLIQHIDKNLWTYLEAGLLQLTLDEMEAGEDEEEEGEGDEGVVESGGADDDGGAYDIPEGLPPASIVGSPPRPPRREGTEKQAAATAENTTMVSLPASTLLPAALPVEVQGMLDDALAAFEEEMSDEEDDSQEAAEKGEGDSAEDQIDVEAALGSDADQRAQHHLAKEAMQERVDEGQSLQEQGYDRASPSEEVQQREKRGSSVTKAIASGVAAVKAVASSLAGVTESTPPPRDAQVAAAASQQQEREASPPPIDSPPPTNPPPPLDSPPMAEPAAPPRTQPSPRRSQAEVVVSANNLSHAFMKKKFGDSGMKELEAAAARRRPSASPSAPPLASTPPVDRQRKSAPPAAQAKTPIDLPAVPQASTSRQTPQPSTRTPAVAGTSRVASHQGIRFHDFSMDEDGFNIDPVDDAGDNYEGADELAEEVTPAEEAQPLHRLEQQRGKQKQPAAHEYEEEEEEEEDEEMISPAEEAERTRRLQRRREKEKERTAREYDDEDEEEVQQLRMGRRPLAGGPVSRRSHGPDEGPARRTPRAQGPAAAPRRPSRDPVAHDRHAGLGIASGPRRSSGGERLASTSRLSHEAQPVHRRSSASRSVQYEDRRSPHVGDTSVRSHRSSRQHDATATSVSAVDQQLAKARYTTNLLLLAKDFGFENTSQLKPFLAPYAGELKRARAKLERHFDGLASEYGVDRETVVDFVRQSGGSLRDAERFLEVMEKSMQRSRGEIVVGEGYDDEEEEEDLDEEEAGYYDDGQGRGGGRGGSGLPLTDEYYDDDDEGGEGYEEEEDIEQPYDEDQEVPARRSAAAPPSRSSRVAGVKRPRSSVQYEEADYEDEEEVAYAGSRRQQQQQQPQSTLRRGRSRMGGDGVASTSRRRLG